jgi:predicted nucleotidyltransferase
METHPVNSGEWIVVAEIITNKRDEIAALCRKYRVARLDLFGSATTDRFDPETSDLDFLVDLGEYEANIVYRYLDLANALEALLDRRVDLLTVRSVRSPLLRQSIDESRVTLYEQGDGKEAA